MSINNIKQDLCGDDLLVIDKNYKQEDINDNSIDIVYGLLEQIVKTHGDRENREISARAYNDKMHSLITEAEIFLLALD